MGTDSFLNHFKVFENNLHLLSPYQVKPEKDFVCINVLSIQPASKLEFDLLSDLFPNLVHVNLSVNIFHLNLVCINFCSLSYFIWAISLGTSELQEVFTVIPTCYSISNLFGNIYIHSF